MTTTLNATTSNGLVVTPDNSGNIVLQYNGVAAPAFSAYLSSNQTISNNTFTKLQADIEEFDTANCYDNTTNYRFTPTVAGYYQINGNIYMYGTSSLNGSCLATIYKNGSRFKDGVLLYGGGAVGVICFTQVSALIYLNGSTDYVELYGLINGTGTILFGTVSGGAASYFQGCLLRGA